MINLTVLLAVIAFFIRSISEQAYNEIGLNQKLLIPKCMKQLIEVCYEINVLLLQFREVLGIFVQT